MLSKHNLKGSLCHNKEICGMSGQGPTMVSVHNCVTACLKMTQHHPTSILALTLKQVTKPIKTHFK